MRPLFLFAHGAGAPSTHPWMEAWAKRLATLGEVVRFDYPYMREGRKTPDRQPKLIEAHKAALVDARGKKNRPVVLIGKSMGSRMGCHVALEEPVSALICLGYPLQGMGSSDPKRRRDAVLKQLSTPVLFVQGTRDKLCPLEVLADTREAMSAPNELFVVESGDHSLNCTKGQLRAWGKTQEDVDQEILEVIEDFVSRYAC
ncbi:MAG: alpha/beta fold hydrolase [Myxococcales bacterium]|nr:alpha/beta fold hydrolase [Myxococcales bacterium]